MLHKKKSRRWPKILLAVIAVMLLVGGVFAAYAYYQTKQTANKIYKASDENASAVVKQKKPLSILLLGIDTGADGRTDKGRSDTMIVATINPTTKKTTFVSIPRDTMAEMTASGETSIQKINSAYEIGGAKTAKKTVSKLLNIPINYYLTLNMGGLAKIVDAVGGVTVTSNLTFTFNNITIKKGTHHLNGKQALSFARMRYDDPKGDYGRQLRQQQVIKAVTKKLLSLNGVANYQKILSVVQNNLQTDLSFSDMKGLAANYRSAATNMVSDQLQGQDAYINGSSYQIASTKEINRISKKLRKQLNLSAETVSNKETELNKANPYFDGVTNTTYTIYGSDSTVNYDTGTYSDGSTYSSSDTTNTYDNTTGTETNTGPGIPNGQF
ncbi:LCP family protein [Loigolactobacillus coryniformis]|uniref:LytR family transcriptional regulator n=1 Tax=Loigolactobacillus coryniformis subsp. torquens DSM 20004 = KCTC 3535 TaxID=1423822 RepID=A0A2D1KQZ6_9LACO|nr:LCP family protein [Loigolactobacillus coryniformis]ATO44550.1 LytR family transcriptional regulator [Loigolactobacillus coryniformis subsp. torquens DSM 20004 = KCTC 3535]